MLGTVSAARGVAAREYLFYDGENGLVDGLLQDCRNEYGCVSSQDDRPKCFLEPFEYDGSMESAKRKLLAAIPTQYPGSERKIVDERYLRIESPAGGGTATDVIEFYFTPNDNTIQFRGERRGAATDLGQNRKRLEKVRIKAGFDYVPVLRNRRRSLGLIESPFDDFGPNTNSLKWALPNNMDPGDLLPNASDFQPNGVRAELDPLAPVFTSP